MKKVLVTVCAVFFVLLLVGISAFSGGSAFWQMDTFADFSKGTFNGVSLSRDGKLSLAPKLQQVFSSDQALIWTVAEDARGNVYLGTGHAGKVFRVDAQSKTSLFFDAPEPDVFALAADGAGNVYAGTSPDGKVYKLSSDGKPQEFFNPQAKYIWSLALAPDGALLVGTGDRGCIYRVTPDGKGSLFYDTQQAHVMSMAFAPDKSLIAGTAPNGLLYRITPPGTGASGLTAPPGTGASGLTAPTGKGSVLYDAPLAEIHSVAVTDDGTVLVSAIAAGQRQPGLVVGGAGAAGDAAAPIATITVQTSNQQGPDIKDKDKPKDPREVAEKAARDAAAAAAAITASAVPTPDFSSGTRSAIYRVAPDRTVETLWSSRDESVFDVLPAPGGAALFSTDGRGRIYQLSAQKETTLLVQTNEEQTTRLLRHGPYVLAATANFGKLFRLESGTADVGTYESPVKDTRSIARWGKLSWRGAAPSGTKVELFTRSGNSSAPDQTWSEWEQTRNSRQVAARSDRFEHEVVSPPARCIQWKAVFRPSGGRSATLEEATVAYLPQNRAPVIQSIQITPVSATPRAASASTSASDQPMVVVVSADDSSKSSSSQASGSSGTPSRPGSQATVNIAWQAEDPDGDRLVYSLYLRGEGESEWRLLKNGLHDTSLQVEPDTLPDGKYQARVVASDAEANPADSARTAEQLSAPFLVDNTPPVAQVLEQERKGQGARVRFRISDAASALRRAEYALDGGAWLPVYSEDGIIDSQTETFLVRLDSLQPGEHVVVIRAYDSGGNAGMGKAILK